VCANGPTQVGIGSTDGLTPGQTSGLQDASDPNSITMLSYVNTTVISTELALAPGGSYLQGVISTTEHELLLNFTANGVDDGSAEGVPPGNIMSDFSDAAYYAPSAPMSADDVIALQDASDCNFQEGDFGGNQGPIDTGSGDVPAVARPRRYPF
jgi:hypothetical protein